MGHFIANTARQQEEMLREAGYADLEELFEDIPEEVRLREGLDLPEGCSELEVNTRVSALAGQNQVFPHMFRGAGAYRHYIPAIVKSVVSKEAFLTAYTPYQAEISQGNLQSIFEFQSMICELTGMDAANASVYDGATAAAESLFMCMDRKRSRVLVSETTNPQVLEVMRTYCHGRNVALELIPEQDGVTSLSALAGLLDEKTACVYIQQPNFYGNIEPAQALGGLAHQAGAKYIMGCNPIALAVLQTPGECGADVAVGEGQPLGMPLSFGGPYLGFMAATKEMMRKLPGRIVGETTDSNGNRGYVLTLQAREQHIRREKAGSNICSNQALCALTAAVYLAAMGPAGLREAAVQSSANAHFLRERLEQAGCRPVHSQMFFHEFVTECPVDPEELENRLAQEGFLCGLPVAGTDGTPRILWCTTELNTVEEMERLAVLVREVCGA